VVLTHTVSLNVYILRRIPTLPFSRT